MKPEISPLNASEHVERVGGDRHRRDDEDSEDDIVGARAIEQGKIQLRAVERLVDHLTEEEGMAAAMRRRGFTIPPSPRMSSYSPTAPATTTTAMATSGMDDSCTR